MVSKLKGLERTKNKIGEEKALMEVSKIIRRFEMRIKSILIWILFANPLIIIATLPIFYHLLSTSTLIILSQLNSPTLSTSVTALPPTPSFCTLSQALSHVPLYLSNKSIFRLSNSKHIPIPNICCTNFPKSSNGHLKTRLISIYSSRLF